MPLKTLILLATLVILVESRVIFRAPDVLEINSQLFIVEDEIKNEFRLILDDMIENDQGNFTHWLNMDHADITMGSTGDYEWLREIRRRQAEYGECIVPCEDGKIHAMEVNIPETVEDQTIMENCVDLLPEARRPRIGFFCLNYNQRRPKSKCRKNAECQKYMTSHCQCPDFEVRYFCRGSASERQQFCDNVEAAFTASVSSGKRSYDGLLLNIPADDSAIDPNSDRMTASVQQREDVKREDQLKDIINKLKSVIH